jgi:hypothetical protein
MNASELKGIWKGEYILGSSYGEDLAGEAAEFILFIEETFNNSFKGKCVDTEGIGVEDYIPCTIEGFIKDDMISFTKKYPHLSYFDEDNNLVDEKESDGQIVVYEGIFDERTAIFKGEWELEVILESSPEEYIMDVSKGTWYMKKED